MMRLNLVLVLAVVLSGLYLVNVQYESRRLYAELDRAQAQSHRLSTENERLQVEKRAQATSARVEQLARTQLQMHTATPGLTTYVTYKPALASSTALPAAGTTTPQRQQP
jgi:cell division protein FtsL